MNWVLIASSHFPKKTPNACRKRHERLLDKRNSENWGSSKFEDLARAYTDSREMMWKILAENVGENWRHVEKMVCFSLLASIHVLSIKSL